MLTDPIAKGTETLSDECSLSIWTDNNGVGRAVNGLGRCSASVVLTLES